MINDALFHVSRICLGGWTLTGRTFSAVLTVQFLGVASDSRLLRFLASRGHGCRWGTL